MRDAQRLRRLSNLDGWVHPMTAQLGTSRDVKLFFCYCCGQHEWQTYCVCCGTRACDRCLQWMYPCGEHGGTWCKDMHVALHDCRHIDSPAHSRL